MNLFVYGELCRAAVLLDLLHRVPGAEPALLRDHTRRRDPESGYYRAFHCAGATLTGLLLQGIESKEMARLDEFEGVREGQYRREEVTVEGLVSRSVVASWVYLAP